MQGLHSPEDREGVRSGDYDLHPDRSKRQTQGTRQTMQGVSGLRVDWPRVMLYLRKVYGSVPEVAAAVSARLGRHIGRHRLQAMVSEQWQSHWEPSWSVGQALLELKREAEEAHDTE